MNELNNELNNEMNEVTATEGITTEGITTTDSPERISRIKLYTPLLEKRLYIGEDKLCAMNEAVREEGLTNKVFVVYAALYFNAFNDKYTALTSISEICNLTGFKITRSKDGVVRQFKEGLTYLRDNNYARFYKLDAYGGVEMKGKDELRELKPAETFYYQLNPSAYEKRKESRNKREERILRETVCTSFISLSRRDFEGVVKLGQETSNNSTDTLLHLLLTIRYALAVFNQCGAVMNSVMDWNRWSGLARPTIRAAIKKMREEALLCDFKRDLKEVEELKGKKWFATKEEQVAYEKEMQRIRWMNESRYDYED